MAITSAKNPHPARPALAAALAVLGALTAAGCGGADEARDNPLRAPRLSEERQRTESLRARALAAPAADANGGYAVDVGSRDAVRLFYLSVYGSSNGFASGWSGSVASCSPGVTSDEFKAAEQRRINWFRAMAGLPAAVTLDTAYNQKAQAAALMMAANNALSHTPPASWVCYSSLGAEGAGSSDLVLGRIGADAIDGYILDPGSNNAEVGHRRWLLYPQTQRMGVGDVQNGAVLANAVWVFDGTFGTTRPAVRDDFVAWPPRGYVPYTTVYPRWSLSYPGADFSAAKITMTENGVAISTRTEPITNGVGENTLVWLPAGYADGQTWRKPSADTAYNVTVSNVIVGGRARSFSYTTTVFDPATDGVADASAPSVRGTDALLAGASGAFTISPAPGADRYQWRSLSAGAFTFSDGAEAGATNFSAATTAGYSVITSDAAASGAFAFHLAHPQAVDQTLQLKTAMIGRAASSLSFSSRLGFATPTQIAMVEASTDDGRNWTALWEQAGSTPESGFTRRTVSLAALKDKSFVLRLRYSASASGSWYPQTTSGVGWYIDDIRIEGADAVSASSAVFDAPSGAFNLGAATGGSAVQARAGMYGYVGSWGLIKRVETVSTVTVDCLFGWAERNYPSLFAPAASTLASAPYLYRYYSGTQIYLGVSSADSNVYYLLQGQLYNAGGISGWLTTASCH